MFKIAIIGRTNVGKSTLFNKLVGRSFAITDDMPGVTRDRKEARAKLGPLEFVVIDTAGLEEIFSPTSLIKRTFEQTEVAVADADLCLFVVDAKLGITKEDDHFAKWLRKTGKPVVLVVNKSENVNSAIIDKELFKLGFGVATHISAEHSLGFGDLYEVIAPEIEKYEQNFGNLNQDDDGDKADLQLAVIGRPNSGKSTFINTILGYERLVTGAEAGITRDSIAIDHDFNGKKIRLIDTAGIRRKSNIVKKIEQLSVLDSFRAMRFAQVAILLIDATSLLDHQDVALASEVIKEGRGLIFAINKIDLVTRDSEAFLREVREQIQNLFPEVAGAAIIGISAKNGKNIEKALQYALRTYEQWQKQVTTAQLNQWLKQATETHKPPFHKGKATKIKYVTQIKKRPPTFVVFTNNISAVEGSYQRYLVNSLRQAFELELTPIRIYVRKSENPFADRREKTFSKRASGDKRRRG